MLLTILADTHVTTAKRSRAQDLPAIVWDSIKESDAVIHAGDVVEAYLLEAIAKIVPVHAVLGNNDTGLTLPERLELQFEQVKLAVLHESGPRKGRPERLRKQFPDAQVVVYGHSHIPDLQTFEGLLIMNPGSCTDRRREPKFSFGRLAIEGASIRPYIVRF
ncbi:MAG: metallophosphoesterase family protein [Cyanobacteria bacterium SZAS LIN-2]|nr:metallophosphoesterase family protein [Cyanobacteria bacterium SZAS LIN-3]MBS1995047.1 metallophosphoesterase family protein [Cyanobacteria bacterium SZAS LIN-2]